MLKIDRVKFAHRQTQFLLSTIYVLLNAIDVRLAMLDLKPSHFEPSQISFENNFHSFDFVRLLVQTLKTYLI